MTVGIHIVADLYGVKGDVISRAENIMHIMEWAVEKAGFTILCSDYRNFEPFGCSGFILLAESHLSFHTWPEYNLLTLDIYSCGSKEQCLLAYRELIGRFEYTDVELKIIERGKYAKEQKANTKGTSHSQEPMEADVSSR